MDWCPLSRIINAMIETSNFRELFNELYSERLKKYQGWKSPPWAKRKNEEIVRSLAHPDLAADLGILFRCEPESIMAIQLVLEEYFVRTYGISVEMAETWVLFMVTKDLSALSPKTQIDGVRFFNADLRIAGPSNDKTVAYKNLLSDIERKDPHINMRIGRGATKQDAKWLLDRYWDEYVAPQLKLNFPQPKDQRRKRELLRNSTIYALHKSGMKVKDIQKYIDSNFEGTIEESLVRKISKEFKPPRNWFEPAIEKLKGLPTQQKIHAKFGIKFIKAPKPHFQIETM